MTFVLDGSVTVAWCFEDARTDVSERALDLLLSEDAVVPMVWMYDVAQVLSRLERRGRISEQQLERFLCLLHDLPIVMSGESQRMEDLLGLARQFGLLVYDAAYLDLALRLHMRLATLEPALARAAQTTRVGLILDVVSLEGRGARLSGDVRIG